jgi:hypothetical protein
MANDSVLFGAFIASLCNLCALAILPANNRAEAVHFRAPRRRPPRVCAAQGAGQKDSESSH